MAGGAVQPASFDTLARAVVGADRIIGAKSSKPERICEMVLQVPRFLYQSSQGAIGVWAPGVEKKTKPPTRRIRVNALTN
jgi:hypothetical protein